MAVVTAKEKVLESLEEFYNVDEIVQIMEDIRNVFHKNKTLHGQAVIALSAMLSIEAMQGEPISVEGMLKELMGERDDEKLDFHWSLFRALDEKYTKKLLERGQELFGDE